MFFIILYVSGRMSATIDPPSCDARHADSGIEREKRSYRLSGKDVLRPVTIHIRREANVQRNRAVLSNSAVIL